MLRSVHQHPCTAFTYITEAAPRAGRTLGCYHAGGDQRIVSDLTGTGKLLYTVDKTGKVEGPNGEPVLRFPNPKPAPTPAVTAIEFGSDKPVEKVRRNLHITRFEVRQRKAEAAAAKAGQDHHTHAAPI